jgi:hypothetical protein
LFNRDAQRERQAMFGASSGQLQQRRADTERTLAWMKAVAA